MNRGQRLLAKAEQIDEVARQIISSLSPDRRVELIEMIKEALYEQPDAHRERALILTMAAAYLARYDALCEANGGVYPDG
jgi:hypothetical protein